MTTLSNTAPVFVPGGPTSSRAGLEASTPEFVPKTFIPSGQYEVNLATISTSPPQIDRQAAALKRQQEFISQRPNVQNIQSSFQAFNPYSAPEFKPSMTRSAPSFTPSSYSKLPEEIGSYWGLESIDYENSNTRRANGNSFKARLSERCTSFKAISKADGRYHCLRRIEGFRLVNDMALMEVEKWANIKHPAVVSVEEAFTTPAFGDNSIVFAYEYHPMANTLAQVHISGIGQHRPLRVTEQMLWAYLCQLAIGIKAVHDKGLAVRTIDASKVLLTRQNRVRINCCSMIDVLSYDSSPPLAVLQQEDLLNLGQLLLSLTYDGSPTDAYASNPIDSLAKNFSENLRRVALFLLAKPDPGKTIDELLRILAPKMAESLTASLHQTDDYELDLQQEYDNGRMVRLMTKLGWINERPEFAHDPRWSETGDRYVIKLFRDFVFHSVDHEAKPVLDLSHVVDCLKKLDAGSEEKIVLISRDEQNCIVVSYKEIKNCMESAFLELQRV